MTRDEVRAAIRSASDDGIVRTRDLRRAGVSGKEILLARRAGDLDRQLQGLDVVGGTDVDTGVQGRLALAHAGDGALLTGLFGARLLNLRWVPDPTRVHVLVAPERRRTGSAGWVLVRRCDQLDQLERLWVAGLPVAPVAQVVVDGARELLTLRTTTGMGLRAIQELHLRDVRGLVLGAVADKRCSVEQIEQVLERSAPAGTALTRRACRDARRGAASPPEAELGDAFAGSGVAHYLNCEIVLNGVVLGVADVWLVGLGTGGELDSREFHERADLLDATLERHDRFGAAGLSLKHRTPTRFRADPQEFVRVLLAEAERRRVEGVLEPAGLELRPRGPLLF